MSNAVKHPSHYAEGRNYEPKDVIRDWGLNFNLGNAVKYLARAGRKDDIVQDLKKAQEYIQFEIDAIEEARKNVNSPEPPAWSELPRFKCAPPSYDDTLAGILYGRDMLARSLARAEACSVKPLVLEIPDDAEPEDIIRAVIDTLYGGR